MWNRHIRNLTWTLLLLLLVWHVPAARATDWDHFLLDERMEGVCARLTGDVELAIVMVETPDAPWDEASRQALVQTVDASMAWLEREAEAYDVPLDVSARYDTVFAENALAIGEDSIPWAEAVLASEPSLPSLWMEDDGDWNPTPVIFCLNTPGRAFACNHNSGEILEYVIAYSQVDVSTICHELMHLYGADDYYVHADVERTAQQLCGDSIMLKSGSELRVDSLTAYVIGWVNELDDNAETMLAETAHLTEEELWEAMDANVKNGFYTEVHDGFVYTGMFQGGTYHGWGTITWDSGNSYEGQWEWGLRTGIGTFRWTDGDIYTGGFKDGVYNGAGRLQLVEGRVYIGEFENGLYHGLGTLTYTNGSVYTGEFADGQRHGIGTLTYADGSVYVGEFVNGQRHGMGNLVYADGSMYTGEFANDQPDGWGINQWASGTVYVGDHEAAAKDGRGTYFYDNGDLYTGEWTEDQQDGQGTYVWSGTGYYAGGYQDGAWHGYGVYNSDDGTLMQGEWENGSFIGE